MEEKNYQNGSGSTCARSTLKGLLKWLLTLGFRKKFFISKIFKQKCVAGDSKELTFWPHLFPLLLHLLLFLLRKKLSVEQTGIKMHIDTK